jgi:hypothetical protein
MSFGAYSNTVTLTHAQTEGYAESDRERGGFIARAHRKANAACVCVQILDCHNVVVYTAQPCPVGLVLPRGLDIAGEDRWARERLMHR